jgi:hypothetical protein
MALSPRASSPIASALACGSAHGTSFFESPNGRKYGSFLQKSLNPAKPWAQTRTLRLFSTAAPGVGAVRPRLANCSARIAPAKTERTPFHQTWTWRLPMAVRSHWPRARASTPAAHQVHPLVPIEGGPATSKELQRSRVSKAVSFTSVSRAWKRRAYKPRPPGSQHL